MRMTDDEISLLDRENIEAYYGLDKDDVRKLIWELREERQRSELAVKALEEYTDDDQYCGRCDGMTYDTGNGEVARIALAEIKRLSGE